MQKLKYPFVLASSSRFRYLLLEQIAIKPDIVFSPDVDEAAKKKEFPAVYSRRIAIEKACAASGIYKEHIIIAADTVIAAGRRILNKPTDSNMARSHLILLSGRRHRCYTTICLIDPTGGQKVKQNMSVVKFKRLHEKEIEFYLSTNQWCGCAGGYTISGYAAAFITEIRGSYSGILGAPLHLVYNLLLQYF